MSAGTAWRLERFDELPSTSDFCVARAKAGAPAGLAVLAHAQTAGRGSRGRSWQAPVGNLNLSVLLRPDVAPAECGVFPLLAGIAVGQAVEQFLPPGIVTTLKWPNDVLLGPAKLAGILIDAAPSGARLDWLVIGMGVNLRHAPEIPGRLTTTLAARRGDVTAPQMAEAVLERLEVWLEVLDRSGAKAVREAWLERAHPVGTRLEVAAGGQVRRGSFAGLSESGELLLAGESGIEAINTGDVLLGTG